MNNEYFWSIVIEQELVQVALWTINDGLVSIVTSSQSFSWETDEDLIEKVDAALSEAVEQIPEDHEPSKTVFGVPSSWVEGGRIKKPHLDKIRMVSQKLSLSPTGFVVLPEAIAHAVKVREGSPLSGVVIGVGRGSLDVTVFRLGNIVGTVSVGRSTSLTEDVVEGLSRFAGGDSVPTRWLLYDGREVDLEEVRQELIKADWGEIGQGLKFLHTPQVEITSEREKVEAVSIAGASEISQIKGVEGAANLDTNVEHADLAPEDIGFVVDKDVKEVAAASKKATPLLAFLRGLRFKPRVSMPGQRRVGAIFGVGALVILGGALAAWLFLSRAEIIINISPRTLKEAETVILDVNVDSPDPANFIFPANLVEAEANSEMTKQTSGTKTVGERAKGSIKIRNGTADEVDFEAGTVVAVGGLEFSLDEGVSVPQASSPTTPGEVSVAVTAADIGEEYNIAGDESFSVGNFPKSEIDAISEGAFSGGTSREIRVISEGDIESLREELMDRLRSQALELLEGKAHGAWLVEEATEYKVLEETVSGEAGDEAESVNISMTIVARGLVIPEARIEELSNLILKDQVPEGFSLRREQVDANFELMSALGNGKWEFDVSLTAKLLPSINVDEVRADIAGKPRVFVEEYLKRIPGYAGAEVTVRPPLPGFLGNIPYRTANISIEVAAVQ